MRTKQYTERLKTKFKIPCPWRNSGGCWSFLGQQTLEGGGDPAQSWNNNDYNPLLRILALCGQDDEGAELELKGSQ